MIENKINKKDLSGTKTEKCLLDAFAGESQARNKYDLFADLAEEQGYNDIAATFRETAHHEMTHARLWFKHVFGLEPTRENLLAAAAGENYESTVMYPEFAATAREEGFTQIANQMEGVAKIEAWHEERYIELAELVAQGKIWESDEETAWICTECGHIHIGHKAPGACPVCLKPQAVFFDLHR